MSYGVHSNANLRQTMSAIDMVDGALYKLGLAPVFFFPVQTGEFSGSEKRITSFLRWKIDYRSKFVGLEG